MLETLYVEHAQRHGTWEEVINALYECLNGLHGRSKVSGSSHASSCFSSEVLFADVKEMKFDAGTKIHEELHMWVGALEFVGCCDHINDG